MPPCGSRHKHVLRVWAPGRSASRLEQLHPASRVVVAAVSMLCNTREGRKLKLMVALSNSKRPLTVVEQKLLD